MNRVFIAILFVSLIFSGRAFAADAQQIYQEKVSKIKWTDLSIEFRPVSETSTRGSQALAVKSADQENGKTYYADKKAILGMKHINNIDVTYNPNDLSMLRLLIRFNAEGKQALSDYTTKNVGEKMGVVIDGQLRLVATLRQPLVNGKVQVYGFAPAEAVDIAQRYYKPKLDLARQIQEEQIKK